MCREDDGGRWTSELNENYKTMKIIKASNDIIDILVNFAVVVVIEERMV